MDQWAGYEANRSRLLKFLADAKIANPITLAGDIHSNWANDLLLDTGDPKSAVVAAEFVGTSISSGGDGSQATKKSPGVLADNPFVKFYNAERGYVACEITPERWTTYYRTVPYVSKPGAPLNTRATFVVENGRKGIERA
jgi:alkaline phosphatase D